MARKKFGGSSLIEVTAELIEVAQLANSNHCMIADAIKAALPDAKAISVDLQTIRFTDRAKGVRYVYFTPVQCQQQLVRFDQGTQVLPWSFRLPSRPAQITKVVAKIDGPNLKKRPTTPGPKEIKAVAEVARGQSPKVMGGHLPPTAVLSNSRGRVRVFGIRAARGFDPSQAG